MPAPAEIQQDHDAAWAIRFRERGTNAASRARRDRQDDQIGAADYNLRQKEAKDQEAFLQSKAGAGARDLMQQRATIENQRRGRDLQEMRFQFDQQKRAFDEDFKLRKERLDMLEAQRAMEKSRFDLDRAEKISTHTAQVERDVQSMLESGLIEGTPGFAAGLMRSIASNPFVEKNARDTYLKAARIEDDPEAIISQMQEHDMVPSGGELGADGKMRLRFKAKEAPGTASATVRNQREISLERMRDKVAELDPDVDAVKIKNMQQRISELQSSLAPTTPAQAAPANPALPPPPSGFKIIGQ